MVQGSRTSPLCGPHYGVWGCQGVRYVFMTHATVSYSRKNACVVRGPHAWISEDIFCSINPALGGAEEVHLR